MGLLLLPCSAPVERCAHFGASDVPNSKEGKTRRTSHAVLVRSPALALRLPVNYGRLSSWEFQRSLFASAQLGWLEGSLFASGSGTCVQMVNICLRAARGSKDSIEDGPSSKTGAALVKPFHPAVPPRVFRSSVHDQAMDQRHLAFAPSRRRCKGSAKDEQAARQGPRPRLHPHQQRARLALGMFEPQHDQLATPLVGTGTRRMIVRDRHL